MENGKWKMADGREHGGTLPEGWSRQPVRTRVFIERNEFSSRQQAVREVASTRGRRQAIGGQWERKSESGQRLPGRTVARNERVPGSGNSNMSRPAQSEFANSDAPKVSDSPPSRTGCRQKVKELREWGLNTQAEKKCNSATTRVVIGPNEGFQSETEVQQALKVKQI